MKKRLFVSAALTLALVLSFAAPASAGSSIFNDVDMNHWAIGEIERAFNEHVIEGSLNARTGIRNFMPESPLSYAAFTTIMMRAVYPDALAEGEAAYPKDWVLAAGFGAEKLGLLDPGMSRGELDSPMPRYDMARVLIKLLMAAGYTEPSQYDLDTIVGGIKDGASLKAEYRDYVAMCYDLGLISGFSDGSVKGDNMMNRAQAAAVYCRYSDLVKRIINGEDVIKTPKKALIEVSESDPAEPHVFFKDYTEFELDAVRQILERTNQERAAQGLGALSINPDLQQAAMKRARELETLFSHTRPGGGDCLSLLDKDFMENISQAGENIAGEQLDGNQAMDDWMQSPGHRENILMPSFTHIGIGAYQSGGHTYYVQMFGKGFSKLESINLP